jgi:hypothetical protein
MPKGQAVDRSVVPVVAGALALGWLAGALWVPDALGPLAVLAVAAAFSLRVAGRPARRAWPAVALVAAWLALCFGGALWFRPQPFAGLAWVVLVVFLVPLPVVPWLYARSFDDAGSGVRGPGSEGQGAGVRGPGSEGQGAGVRGPGSGTSKDGETTSIRRVGAERP